MNGIIDLLMILYFSSSSNALTQTRSREKDGRAED